VSSILCLINLQKERKKMRFWTVFLKRIKNEMIGYGIFFFFVVVIQLKFRKNSKSNIEPHYFVVVIFFIPI
jgi:hypothetical protein